MPPTHVLRLTRGVESHAPPQAIPIATVCSVCSLISFIVAFWPVWGWLTIPGIMILFFGLLHLAHFVPA